MSNKLAPHNVEQACTSQCRTSLGWYCRPKLSSRNRFTLFRQLHRWSHGKRQLDRKKMNDWVYSIKKVQHVPTQKVHILLSSAHYNKNSNIYDANLRTCSIVRFWVERTSTTLLSYRCAFSLLFMILLQYWAPPMPCGSIHSERLSVWLNMLG